MSLPVWLQRKQSLVPNRKLGYLDAEDAWKLFDSLHQAWRSFEEITSIADSFGPDHPMPNSTYFMACSAAQAMKTIEGIMQGES